MKLIFFSKLFKVKGKNNVSGSNGTSIEVNGLSEYCRAMIHKLMDENHLLSEKLRKERAKNKRLRARNKKLDMLLKDYLDSDL